MAEKIDEAKKRPRISDEKKAKIMHLIKTTMLSQADIAKKVGASRHSIGRIAREEMTEDEYEARFNIVSDKTKAKILHLIKTSMLSQADIAKKVGASRHSIGRIAREEMTEDEYEARFQTVSDKTKAKILQLIKTTTWLQPRIAKEVGVSLTTVRLVAREEMKENEYEARFQTVSDKTKAKIWQLIKTTTWTQEDIAKEVGVSRKTVERVATEKMTEKEIKKRFPQRKLLAILYHKKVTEVMSDWGEKRAIPVLTEYQIMEEIPRLKETGKRPDNVIVVTEKFRKLYPIPIPSHIKFIALDYSFDTSQTNFITKSERKYQAGDTLFYHIPIEFTGRGYHAERNKYLQVDYKVPENLPYKENIHVLPLEQFFSVFDFSDKERKNLIDQLWKVYKRSIQQKDLLDFF